ncbi:FecR domain-containing protein [Flavivirga amylovorans]|uniref:FecR domain-containing protein n=1 Tax=Flavivirga amylovorans TaxID=870486 RepID=A0ABT8X2I7_9FLAO|nr:FecR domain-containing protein [Flavivirga amylovorans]MDO5988174.1 FecR domain-containing protein [Flavivirga amylovorans]
MKNLQNIFSLAKKSVSSLLNHNKIEKNEIEQVFSSEHSEEIVKRLQDFKSQKARKETITLINKGKKSDWKKIQKQIKPSTKIHYLKAALRVAAILVITLGSTYYFTSTGYFSKEKLTENPLHEQTSQSTEDIILKLSNGKTQIINSNESLDITDDNGSIVGTQKGKKLNYHNKNTTVSKTLVYNELIVPYGKTFELTLSDGTLIHLNSGTVLKYPVQFLSGKNREVFLTGEAYFKVNKDQKHPFIVNANNLNIRVLGTEFNVSSYPEDKNINTVLVEGSVGLYAENESYSKVNARLLEPGKKAKWNKSNQKITIEKVDTSIYTSWIDGTLVIEHLKFHQIIKRLEKHYNVEIINNNEQLAEQIFTATFRVENIKEVLDSFKTNFSFEYIIRENTIIINH